MVISNAIPLATVLMTLLGGWLVSTKVADRWDQTKKRRDMNFAATQDFQRLYGEFFAIWKVWNATLRYKDLPQPPVDLVWGLLGRASAMEGGIEALLMKVSAEYFLSGDDIDALGALRQGFQSLRNTIQRQEPLSWWASEMPDYAAFKSLATFMSGFLGSGQNLRGEFDPIIAADNFSRITDNRFEHSWVDLAGRRFPREKYK
jgi:hypothetical protein